MSKSRGNVINPDDVVGDFGADSLRLYEMFMGPLRDTKVRAAGHLWLCSAACLCFVCQLASGKTEHPALDSVHAYQHF